MMVFYKVVKKYFMENRKKLRKKLKRPTVYYLLSFLDCTKKRGCLSLTLGSLNDGNNKP